MTTPTTAPEYVELRLHDARVVQICTTSGVPIAGPADLAKTILTKSLPKMNDLG